MCIPVRILCRGVYFFASFHNIKLIGKPDMTVAAFPVAPHYSFFDVVLGMYLGFTNAVTRKGNEDVALLGSLVKLCQPIIVNREKYDSRNDTVQIITERAKSNGKWSPVMIFPEGTCTNGKALIKFKVGAFLPGLPVQPVCVKYSETNFDSVSYTWLGKTLG